MKRFLILGMVVIPLAFSLVGLSQPMHTQAMSPSVENAASRSAAISHGAAFAFTFIATGKSVHSIGNTTGGCFGFDPTDSINEIATINVSSYTLYSKFNCAGSAVLASGPLPLDRHFDSSVKFASVSITPIA